MSQLGNDVRFALRMLLTSPGFTLIAVLTLALGIGANSTIFSVADALVWKTLPYPQPGRLVMVMDRRVESARQWIPTTPGTFLDWPNRAGRSSTWQLIARRVLISPAARRTPAIPSGFPARCSAAPSPPNPPRASP